MISPLANRGHSRIIFNHKLTQIKILMAKNIGKAIQVVYNMQHLYFWFKYVLDRFYGNLPDLNSSYQFH